MGLTDYHTVITQPMDLGTVTEKLGDGKYAKEEEFCQQVMLTFNNAMTYNGRDTEIHLLAVKMRNKFRDLWTKARPESNFNETLDSSELNGDVAQRIYGLRVLVRV